MIQETRFILIIHETLALHINTPSSPALTPPHTAALGPPHTARPPPRARAPIWMQPHPPRFSFQDAPGTGGCITLPGAFRRAAPGSFVVLKGSQETGGTEPPEGVRGGREGRSSHSPFLSLLSLQYIYLCIHTYTYMCV